MCLASVCAQAETLAIYLDQPLPGVDATFRDELRTLLRSTGYTLEIRNYHERKASEAFDRLMVVRLKGVCSAESLPSSHRPGPLASTQVQGNRVLPFADLYCDRTLATISGWLQNEPAARRNMLFGKALARVLAHEAYHFLAQEVGHAANGVAKSCFHTRDLLADTFTFDNNTIARMLPGVGELAPTETEEASGR
ncbi:MAG: hypothetical protein JNK87_03435 [Bryobacterales bacterium]|nr:hypothetical protein [Bryobacterales bacterium]